MKNFYLLIFFILVVLVDQISKIFIQNYMLSNFSEIEIFPFLKLTLVYNSGIAFGILNDLAILPLEEFKWTSKKRFFINFLF